MTGPARKHEKRILRRVHELSGGATVDRLRSEGFNVQTAHALVEAGWLAYSCGNSSFTITPSGVSAYL